MTSSINPDLAVRSKTALILIVAFLAAVNFAIYSDIGKTIFAGLIFILVAIASCEFCKLPGDQSLKIKIFRSLSLILPALLVLLCGLFCPFYTAALLLALVVASVFLIEALSLSYLCMNTAEQIRIEELLATFGRDRLGFLLLGAGGASAVALALLSPMMALGLVIIVAVADSAAYFAGRFYGKRKIAPVISPKKTVAGSVVGILSAGLVGMLFLLIVPQINFISWPVALLLSIGLALCSQSGDYAKSIVKRRYDIKDFGNIFPGHGGALDRLDGLLGAAPLMLVMVVFLCNR